MSERYEEAARRAECSIRASEFLLFLAREANEEGVARVTPDAATEATGLANKELGLALDEVKRLGLAELLPHRVGDKRTFRLLIEVAKKEPTWVPSPWQLELNKTAYWNRKPTTRWSDKELRAFKAAPIEFEDLKSILRYYRAEMKPGDLDMRRRDLKTLLNNWAGEVDRAREWELRHKPKNTPIGNPYKYRPATEKQVEEAIEKNKIGVDMLKGLRKKLDRGKA